MRDSGRVSLGNLLFLLLVSAGIYAAVLYVPLWVDNLDVREAAGAAFNLSGRNTNDAVLRQEIRTRTSHMGTHVEKDDLGREVVVPGLGLTDEDIVIERSSVTDSVRIQIDYDRDVRLAPTQFVRRLHFQVVREGVPPR